MSLPTPWREPLTYDQPIVAGRKWFGYARVEGCERETDVQENKGKGSDGATVNVLGGKLAKPKITFGMWEGWDEAGHWVNYIAVWEEYRKLFSPAKDPKNPSAIVIEHPQLQLADIKSVIVTKVGDLKMLRNGCVECTVEFIEYRKPKPSAGTVKSAIDKMRGAVKPKNAVELAVEQEAKGLEIDTNAFKNALGDGSKASTLGRGERFVSPFSQ